MATPEITQGPDSAASSADNAKSDSSVGSYLIKKGDNLTKIAKNNNTTISEILKVNPQITNRDLIYAGAKLSLPTTIESSTGKVDPPAPAEQAQSSSDPVDTVVNVPPANENTAKPGNPANDDANDYGGAAGASSAEYAAITSALGAQLGTKPLSITGSSVGSPSTAKSVTPFLRDYQHASKLFLGGQLPDGQQGLLPKSGFLFHVVFDLNPNITRDFSIAELGLLVKTATLPKFTVDLKQQNAYNRVNYVQTKIKYDPVQITFHDDSSNVVRDFWFSYFNYYYRDSDYSEPLYQIKHKYNERSAVNWGYTPKKKKKSEFLNSVRIFSLHQKNFSEYVLVNPIIKSFKHGDHRYEDGNGLMSHDMTIEYETVLYYSGKISEDTVKGFGSIHYDLTPSPNLSKEANLVGPGSATDRTGKGSNRLPPQPTAIQSLEIGKNNTAKPPAKDWLTAAGESVFGTGRVGSFINSAIFVPVAKSVAYSATSKITTAVNRTIGQSIAKVKGALGPIGTGLPEVTSGFGGIPNIGTYIANYGPNAVSTIAKKLNPFDQSVTQANNTPDQIKAASTLSVLSITDQNINQTNINTASNLLDISNTNQGQPRISDPANQSLKTLTIDNQIKSLSQNMKILQTQLGNYQSQLSSASTNLNFFNNQIDKNLSSGFMADSPIIIKLQSHINQQTEIKTFAEQQIQEIDQQLLNLRKSKQMLIKEIAKNDIN